MTETLQRASTRVSRAHSAAAEEADATATEEAGAMLGTGSSPATGANPATAAAAEDPAHGPATATAQRGNAILPALQLGPIKVDTPVVLAPMAGITNTAFRRLCRQYGGGLYVNEMVTARALVERRPESLRIIKHEPDEVPRSVQLYSVDPVTTGHAVRMLVEEDRADHIDLNFGCPVPKVTRKGGGAALPWKLRLFESIVATTVREASRANIPVTVKMRKGVDEDHLTYLEAGRIARDSGVAAVALHGRTARQHYSGTADWDAITRLREAITDIPVLGNGDIWSAEDALAMVEQTGVDGVVVGRGCQGRPWLFGDLQAAFEGRDQRYRPDLPMVIETLLQHAKLLIPYFDGDERKAMQDIRKHVAWYFKGYPIGGALRSQLVQVETLAQLEELLAGLDQSIGYPGEAAEGPRGRAGSPKKVHLPQDWLESQELNEDQREMIAAAEVDISGG